MSGRRGGLPSIEQTERLAPQGVVRMEGGGAMQALSQTFEQLSRTLTQVGRTAADAEAEREFGAAREQALTAPIRDEAGNYRVPDPDFSTRTGRMSAETFLGRIADEENVSARERAVRIRAEVGGDPQRFEERWRGDMEGRRAAIPPHAWERVAPVLRQVGVDHLNSQRMEVVAREQRLTQAGWRDVLGALDSDAEGLARAGRIDSPEFADVTRRRTAHLDRGVREGFISPESRQVQLDALRESAGGQAVFRNALDRLDAGESAEEVTRSFETSMDGYAMSPGSRSALRGMLRTAVNEHASRQAHVRSEIRGDLEDWQNVAAAGLTPFDPTTGVRLAERAEAAGDTALAARIRRQQQAYIETNGLRAASLPDLQRRGADITAEMRAAVSDEERAAILGRLRAVREMETARVRQMREDPFGTAMRVHAGKNGVGEMRPLDFTSIDTLADQLTARVSVARLLGALEGMADSMPVLTAPEATQLAGIVRTGTRDQQVALLQSMTRLPADTMRRTMEGMLPGTETERDPRVLSFMAAAGLTQRDPRLALEVINGMERLRATPAPALAGAEVDRHIESRIGEAYAVNPAAYAAVRAAARAVYAERAGTGLDPSQPGGSRADPSLAQRFDSGLMDRVLRQVAPTITFNGQMVPPPMRDGRLMTEAEFREQMSTIPPHVLGGARAANGAAITGDMIRRSGALIAVGEGRYGVTISGFRVNGTDGRPLVLDARQPWPAAPDDFRMRLRQSESGQRIGIVNSEGFAGLYQFGTERLAELNFYSPAPGEGRNGWRGVLNIPGFPQVRTREDFLRTPAAQEFVADAHFANIDDAIARLGTAAARMDRDGLRAVAHLGGIDGMRRFVRSGGTFDRADSNGTTLSAYYRRFSAGGGYQEGANR